MPVCIPGSCGNASDARSNVREIAYGALRENWSKRSFESVLAQLSSYSNAAARVWYEGNAPTGFVAQVEAWKRDYPGLDIVEAGSREPWRSLKVWRKLPQKHDYLGLDFSTWHTYLPIPWLWKKIYHDRPRFNSESYTVVDFL